MTEFEAWVRIAASVAGAVNCQTPDRAAWWAREVLRECPHLADGQKPDAEVRSLNAELATVVRQKEAHRKEAERLKQQLVDDARKQHAALRELDEQCITQRGKADNLQARVQELETLLKHAYEPFGCEVFVKTPSGYIPLTDVEDEPRRIDGCVVSDDAKVQESAPPERLEP